MSPTLEEWNRRLEEARDSADALSIGLDAARDLEGEEVRIILERMEERHRFLESKRERYRYWMGRAGNVTTRIGLKRLATALEKEFPGGEAGPVEARLHTRRRQPRSEAGSGPS